MELGLSSEGVREELGYHRYVDLVNFTVTHHWYLSLTVTMKVTGQMSFTWYVSYTHTYLVAVCWKPVWVCIGYVPPLN